MPSQFVHAVVGALASFGIAFALGLPALPLAPFAGVMAALLLNLDRFESPRGLRSPRGHSLLMGWVWNCTVAALLWLLSIIYLTQQQLVLLSLGAAIGIWSHLALDSFTDEGIYTIPSSLRRAFVPLPDGATEHWEKWGLLRSQYEMGGKEVGRILRFRNVRSPEARGVVCPSSAPGKVL